MERIQRAVITASVSQSWSRPKYYRVDINEQIVDPVTLKAGISARLGATPYEHHTKERVEAVAEFINSMHPETREGWFLAWTA